VKLNKEYRQRWEGKLKIDTQSAIEMVRDFLIRQGFVLDGELEKDEEGRYESWYVFATHGEMGEYLISVDLYFSKGKLVRREIIYKPLEVCDGKEESERSA